MSTVAGGMVAGASGAVFGSPVQGMGNAMYFGDAYSGGQFLTDIVAGGILGGVAGGVAGWIKNMRAAKTDAPRVDPWGFKSAGSKGASVTFDAPEPTGAWGPDGKPLDKFAGYSFEGMEYLDEGIRSTPQPFAGAANIVKTVTQFSKHSLERLAQRGVTQDMAELAISKGQKFYDPLNKSINYVLPKGFASGKSLLVGTNPLTGEVTTVIRSSKNLINSRFVPIK